MNALTQAAATSSFALNGSSLLYASPQEQNELRVVEKPPAYILGEYVLRPLMDKVSAVFVSVIRYLDRATSFPMAAAARIPVSLSKQTEFLGKISDMMGIYDELSGAHRKMEALLETAKRPDAPNINLGQQALAIITDLISLGSGPATFIVDKFVDGVREKQLEEAFGGIEQLAARRDKYNEDLAKLVEQKRKSGDRTILKNQRADLQNRRQGLVEEIKRLEIEEGNKIKTLKGIQQELEQKWTQRKKISKSVDQLTAWMKKAQDYLKNQEEGMKAHNEWFRKNYGDLSYNERDDAGEENRLFQERIKDAVPKVEKAVKDLNGKTAEMTAVDDSIDRLHDYLKDTKNSRDEFSSQILAKSEERNKIDQEIDRLSAHIEL